MATTDRGRGYPVSVSRRQVDVEPRPEGGGVAVFDEDAAAEINRARLDHLESLGLPLAGRSVLDVGGGVGHLAQFFVERGCRVVTTDARPENVTRAHELYPTLDARVLDVETDDLDGVGAFDIVFCYGLLYHLENPLLALRKLAAACRELMLVETLVCDSSLPLVRLDEEPLSSNQALRGIGSRPSPSYVVLGLNRAGFHHVYQPVAPPRHADYEFEWRDDLGIARDGHLLRCVFVASRTPIANPRLGPLLEE